MDALTRVGLGTRPTRLQASSRSDSPKRSPSPTSITTTSSPPTTPLPSRCLRTRPTRSQHNRFKPPPNATLYSWMPRLSSRTTPHPPSTKAALCSPTLTPCLLGWPYCLHSYCTEALPLISHLFIPLPVNLLLTTDPPHQVGPCHSPAASQFLPVTTYHHSIAVASPAFAFSPASASGPRPPALSPQSSAPLLPSTALDCQSLALLPASAADHRSSASALQSCTANHPIAQDRAFGPFPVEATASLPFPQPTAFAKPHLTSSSSNHLIPTLPMLPTTTRPLPPPNTPLVCPAKEDGTSGSTSSWPTRPASRKSVGPHAPTFLPSHLPTTAESYADWIDTLSDDFAGCLATGLASPDTCSNDQDSISNWESCGDSNWESCSDTSSENDNNNIFINSNPNING